VAEWAGIIQPSRYDDDFDDFDRDDAVEAQEDVEVTASVPEPERQASVTPIDQRRSRRPANPVREAARDEVFHSRPRSYASDATRIAENYRDGILVVLNLSDLDDAEAFRLIDFASGLRCALDGHLEKITSRVFLLAPPTMKVTTGDKERIIGGLAAQA
jgi:cell division inhibitor SepF